MSRSPLETSTSDVCADLRRNMSSSFSIVQIIEQIIKIQILTLVIVVFFPSSFILFSFDHLSVSLWFLQLDLRHNDCSLSRKCKKQSINTLNIKSQQIQVENLTSMLLNVSRKLWNLRQKPSGLRRRRKGHRKKLQSRLKRQTSSCETWQILLSKTGQYIQGLLLHLKNMINHV